MKRPDISTLNLTEIPLLESIADAFSYLTEARYEDPHFVGAELARVRNLVIKMRVEGWSPVCIAWANELRKSPEDFTEEIFQQWDAEEYCLGFKPLPNCRAYDPTCGEAGQHFAFYIMRLQR